MPASSSSVSSEWVSDACMNSSLRFRTTFLPGLRWAFLPLTPLCLEPQVQSPAAPHRGNTLPTPRVGSFPLPLFFTSAARCRAPPMRGTPTPPAAPAGRSERGEDGGGRQPRPLPPPPAFAPTAVSGAALRTAPHPRGSGSAPVAGGASGGRKPPPSGSSSSAEAGCEILL